MLTREDMLLVKLMEECGEVIQVCSKALRFGLTHLHPKSGNIPNRELISREFMDVCHVANMLEDEGVIPDYWVDPEIAKARIEKYLAVSQDLNRMAKEEPTLNCPNCPNQGWYPEYGHSGEPVQIQCEYCNMEPNSVYNRGRVA